MGNLNYIVFGGIDSRDYGIYISGEGVFNAPERDVEVVNIPGKDGDLLIDRGRFLNIQVIYPGFNFEPDLSTFAERLRAFRAALASQVGYQRLEDSFHPDEFRLASFRSGLDVKPVMYNTASTFDIVFDCKPQRFLKSGEEEITIGEWGETETITGEIATFEGTDTTAIKSVVAEINPIQSGSGDPSPTNVRPISGWESVNAYRSNKNLLHHIFPSRTINGVTFTLNDDGSVTATGTATANAEFSLTYRTSGTYGTCWLKKGTYIVSGCPSGGGSSKYEIGVNATVNGSGVTLARDYGSGATFTLNDDGYVGSWITIRNGQTVDLTFYPMIRVSTETDATYSPYQGESHSIPFKDENGDPVTVYGGNMNITDGEGSNGMGIVDLGSLAWIKPFTDYSEFRSTGLTNFKTYSDSIVANACCSKYPILTTNQTYRGANTGLAISSYVSIGDSSYTDAATFKEAMSGVMLVYELATPTPIYCEPTEINTLDGVNNIWADSGEVSVEIGEDPNILVNPTPFEALPIFEVVGTGSLTVGNTTINITGDSTQDIFIDSDIMEAYEDDNGAIISRNDRINLSGTDFPKLGEETRVEANGLTSVKITPKWWTI